MRLSVRGFGHSHYTALLFDFGQTVDNLLFLRRFDAFGQVPARAREPRALLNLPEEGGGYTARRHLLRYTLYVNALFW
jgi:hypothetical protein